MYPDVNTKPVDYTFYKSVDRQFNTNEGVITMKFDAIPKLAILSITTQAELMDLLMSNDTTFCAFSSLISSTDNWSWNGTGYDDLLGTPVSLIDLQTAMLDMIAY